MDALQSVSENTGNIVGIASRPLNSICNFRKAIAIEAYQREGGRELSRNVQLDAKIVHAVKRWTAREDVRIEFYTTKGAGAIRVKIIKTDTDGTTCDMSLATFMGISPATI